MRLPRTPLPGWKAELLPDGSARLRRTSGGQLLQDAWIPFGCFLAFFFFVFKFVLRGSNASTGVTVLWGALSLLSLAVLVLVLVWAFAAQEELLIRPKTLTRRRFLGGYEQSWTIDGQAALRIETVVTRHELHRRETETTRALLAEHGAQSRVVDRRTGEGTYYGLKMRTLSGMVSDAIGGANWGDEMLRMGGYLSEQTGWPLTDDNVASPTR